MKKNNLDPRTKLIIVLVISTLAILYNDISYLSLLLFIAIIIAIWMKSDLINILKRIKKLIVLMIAIAFVQSIATRSGNPILSFRGLTLITDYGLIKALEFTLRISIIIISSVILTTSNSRELVQGLVQMKVPYEIAFMVSIAIRFLPIFRDEMADKVIALQLRGVDLKKIKLKEKLKVYKYLLLPITTNSILKAKELATAMEMRGFRAYPQRTSFLALKMKNIDYIVITMSFVGFLGFIIIL